VRVYVSMCTTLVYFSQPIGYGVASISRMLRNKGLFCKRALQKSPIFCKETYILKHPINGSHRIACFLMEMTELKSYSSVFLNQRKKERKKATYREPCPLCSFSTGVRSPRGFTFFFCFYYSDFITQNQKKYGPGPYYVFVRSTPPPPRHSSRVLCHRIGCAIQELEWLSGQKYIYTYIYIYTHTHTHFFHVCFDDFFITFSAGKIWKR